MRVSAAIVTPRHPVTGLPAPQRMPEERELALARQSWRALRTMAVAEGFPVDPPGARLERIREVFDRLVAVAHRPSLPWAVHLIGSPEANAYTVGGGLVVVLEGLFDGLVPAEDDDALAAVLAHEIAHVSLLHVPRGDARPRPRPLLGRPGFAAAGPPDTEAARERQADRLSVLYLALAGFDPMATARVWAAADERRGGRFDAQRPLGDHPEYAERAAATASVARRVAEHRIPGRRNPAWERILAENGLFPSAREVR